jgi:hypothetical protein
MWWKIFWRCFLIFNLLGLIIGFLFNFSYDSFTANLIEDVTAPIKFKPTFWYLAIAIANFILHKISKVSWFIWKGVISDERNVNYINLWLTAALISFAAINMYAAIFLHLEGWINVKLFSPIALYLVSTIALTIVLGRKNSPKKTSDIES